MQRVLIANRCEITRRIIRTARGMGLGTVAVYSDADRQSPHVQEADQAVRIGPAPATESYLSIAKIIEVARAAGADAIHPGYGFLSENPEFAEACQLAGITFIGPSPQAIRLMGLKDEAKRVAQQAGLPVIHGAESEDQSQSNLRQRADAVGYPLMIKAAAGGGGKGMRLVHNGGEFAEALESAKREAAKAFGNDAVILERYVADARHVEVQVFGDIHGTVVHLFERDCSLQRRHQKVVEEAPAPGLSDQTRHALGQAAVAVASAIAYTGAGTVEFLLDDRRSPPAFYFMEMNTRLQVEHPVTELVTGIDLVEWQIRVARGEHLPLAQSEIALRGHAVEARLYAEDGDRGHLPSTGRISRLRLPAGQPGLRIDSGVVECSDISPFYDPMIAKLIGYGPDRRVALSRLLAALDATVVEGVKTNRAFLGRLLSHPGIQAGPVPTSFLGREEEALKPPAASPDRHAAAAAIVAAGRWLNQGETLHSPWTALGPWRMSLPLDLDPVLLRADGKPLGAHVERRDGLWHVSGLDQPYRIAARWRADNCLEVEQEGRIAPLAVLATVDAIEVREHGVTSRFPRAAADISRSRQATASGEIRAPMPGKVTALFVMDGSEVVAGDRLLVLEAMKMEHRIVAPFDGVVRSIHVSAGATIAEDALLVDVEKRSGEAA
jgi:3-methylcrotonyl-CoA carboxylase alpha subunit